MRGQLTDVVTQNVLPYADPRANHGRWGPFSFMPSIRSIALIIVLIGSFIWVRARHQPWVHLATTKIPQNSDPMLNLISNTRSDTSFNFTLTPDNHLLLGGRDGRVRLYDSSGRFVRDVSTVPAHYQFLKGGTQVLLLERHKPEGVIVDVFDGRVIKTVANPIVKNYQIQYCNDDASRVLTSYSLLGTRKWAIWDLSAGEHWSSIKPIFEGPDEITAPDSPDGSYLLIDRLPTSYRSPRPRIMWLKDLRITDPPEVSSRAQYIRNYQIAIAGMSARQPSDCRLEVRNVVTGKLLLSAPFPLLQRTSGGNFSVSNDGTLLAVTHMAASRSFTDVYDLSRGVQIGSRGVDRWPAPRFIPGSRHFIQYSSKYNSQCIFDDPGAEPLMLIPGSKYGRCEAPNSGLIVGVSTDEVHFFKPPGPECRLSRLGILGMPHTWLLIVAGLATVVSLIFDARRRSAVTIVPLWISLPTGILVAAASLYTLLWLILGRRELTPVPLLLFVMIALSLGSKFWRWTSLALLAALILWYANLLRLYFQLSPAAPSKFLDTFYMSPRLLPLIIPASSSAIALLLLLTMLLRRPRHSARPQVLQ